MKRHKTEINDMIKKAISEGVTGFTTSFEVEIKSGSPNMERQYRFALHHSIQNYPEKESLRTWSQEEAMVPWVAVASEIRVSILQNCLKL
jgi:sacsin